MRAEFEERMGGSRNAYRLAIIDNKVAKFEPITMRPIDIQFLQGIQATDVEICNFFGVPLNKVNMGKQSYSSNEQNNLDYLGGTLDPYLVQIEQAARVKWLPENMQDTMYFKFYRKALLQIDAQARADVNTKNIGMGVTNPNEAREDEDLSGYREGEKFWMSRNYSPTDNAFFTISIHVQSVEMSITRLTARTGKARNTPKTELKKTVLNVSLDPDISVNATIFVNQDGFNFLDQLKDGMNRPLMQPDPTSETQYRIKGRPVALMANRLLPSTTVDTKTHSRIIIGDAKSAITLFARSGLEMVSTTVGGNAWYNNNTEIRGIMRANCQKIDDGAVTAIDATID